MMAMVVVRASHARANGMGVGGIGDGSNCGALAKSTETDIASRRVVPDDHNTAFTI
jgi:hypothetical protein